MLHEIGKVWQLQDARTLATYQVPILFMLSVDGNYYNVTYTFEWTGDPLHHMASLEELGGEWVDVLKDIESGKHGDPIYVSPKCAVGFEIECNGPSEYARCGRKKVFGERCIWCGTV